MIQEGVDAVFLSPVDWEAITPALEALDEADIPVINVDTQVKSSDLTEAFIGSDNKNAGTVCGENLKIQCPEGGKVVLLECPSQNSVNERITGFEEAIKNAGFEVVARADAVGNRWQPKKKWLRSYQKIQKSMWLCAEMTKWHWEHFRQQTRLEKTV